MITVKEDCNGCGICRVVCPYGRVRILEGRARIEECEECGVCLKFCPLEALEIKRELREFEFEKEIVETSVESGRTLEIKIKHNPPPIDVMSRNLKFAVEIGKAEILRFKAYELLKICSVCGACTLCKNNALRIENGRPVLVGNCVNCGFCLYVCPKFNDSTEVCEGRIEEIEIDLKTFLKKIVRRYTLVIYDSIVKNDEELEHVLNKMVITLDEDRCVSCGVCVETCPISAVDFDGFPIFQNCFLCGLCVKNCEQKALKKPKYPTVSLLREDFDVAVFIGFPCDVLAVKRLRDDRIICTISLKCEFCDFDEGCKIKDVADITIGEKLILRTERGDRIWKSIE